MKSLVEVEVDGLAEALAPAVELVAVAAEVVESATEDSSSLSVSIKSSGFLMAGAASRSPKGSASVPFPKNMVSKVINSRQSVPARAMNKCCKASCLRAAAFASSSAESRNRRSDCNKTKKLLVTHWEA